MKVLQHILMEVTTISQKKRAPSLEHSQASSGSVLNRGITFPYVDGAEDIWYLNNFQYVICKTKCEIFKRKNGCQKAPTKNAILIWQRCEASPFGLIGVITEVNLEFEYIRVAEQNYEND